MQVQVSLVVHWQAVYLVAAMLQVRLQVVAVVACTIWQEG